MKKLAGQVVRLRVMTFNIQIGFGTGRMAGYGLEKAVEVIRQARADMVVGLQEVLRHGQARTRCEDQARVIAEALGWHYAYLPVVPQTWDPGCNHYPAGERGFGVAIFSRYPILSISSHILTYSPPPEEKWKEQRGVLQATIEYKDAWMEKGAGPGYTKDAGRPHKRIDYIFYDPDTGLELVGVQVTETLASDHYPVVAEFVWHAGGIPSPV